MGKRRTYVGTQVDRVIPDDQLPKSVRKGVTEALFKNGEIIDYVLEELISNIGVRAERLYAFAEAGKYVHGLPSGEFKVPGDQVLPAVKTVLDGLHGASVTVEYAHFGAPNNLHIGWTKLLAEHGYNPTTNQLANLSVTKGFPVYLKDMVLVVPQADLAAQRIEFASLDQWGVSPKAGFTPARPEAKPGTASLVSHTPVEASSTILDEQIRVEYQWKDATDVIHNESFLIPVSAGGLNDDLDYFQAAYTVAGTKYYWTYQFGLGTYPTLDQLFDGEGSVGGEFFPFIYFRFGKVSEGADKTSESYKDNEKLCKYLGLNYEQLVDGVHENPDINDVEQAMMMFAVPANTTNELEQKYLFEFFSRLFLAQGTNLRFQSEAQADIASRQLAGSDLQPPGIVIQDARFKMSLNNRGIYRIRKKGSVAPVGQHSSGFQSFNVTRTFVEYDGVNPEPIQYQAVVPMSYHYYRKQVTHDVYEELQVVGLETRFHINGQYSTTGDEEDKILIVPLDHSITENYSIPEREILYARSLQYVFNSLVVVKLKWYQTGLFKVLITIAAIVISIYTGFADGGQAIVAALAAGAYTYAAQLIITMVLSYLIVQEAFKLFVKIVGVRAAFVVAIIAAVMGFTQILQSGGLNGAPWAQELLQLASGLLNTGAAAIQGDLIGLQAEYEEFSKFVEEQIKTLETAQALLAQDVRLSPFVIFGEKPDDFYNRTVHSGNIGVVGIEAISTFVESRLALPKLHETLGLSPDFGGNQA